MYILEPAHPCAKWSAHPCASGKCTPRPKMKKAHKAHISRGFQEYGHSCVPLMTVAATEYHPVPLGKTAMYK